MSARVAPTPPSLSPLTQSASTVPPLQVLAAASVPTDSGDLLSTLLPLASLSEKVEDPEVEDPECDAQVS